MALSFSNLLPPNAAQSALNAKMSPEPLSSASLANAKAKGIGPGTISLNPVTKPATTPAVAPVSTNPVSTNPVSTTPASTQPVVSSVSTVPTVDPVQSTASVVPPPVSTDSQTTATSNPNSYGGLVGGLVKNAQATAAQTQMTPAEQALRQHLAELEASRANATTNAESHGWDKAFQGGQEGIIDRNINSQEAAVNQGIQSEVLGRQTAATALGSAAGQLGTAISASAPQVTTPGQAVFNPVAGTYTSASSGGNGDPSVAPSGYDQTAWDQYVNDYATGNFGAIPSTVTGNTNISGQLQAAVKAKNPGFNYNTAVGAGSAQQSNASLAGTTTPEAYAAIYKQAMTDYSNLQQSVGNVDSFGNLLTSNMTSGGINPSDVKYANKSLAQIRSSLSSGAQAQYDTTLAALRSKITGMLSIGGSETPTAVTADAQKILDGSLPLSQLQGVLDRIQSEGNILLKSQAAKVNAAKSGTMGPGTGGSGSAPSHDPLGLFS